MTVASGRVPWGSKSGASFENGGFSNDVFFSLRDDGDYLIALLETMPQPFKEHWAQNAQGQMRSYRCSLSGCTLCKEAQAMMNSPDQKIKEAGKSMMAKTKYAIEVFVLAERGQKLGTQPGRPAIMEMTKQIFDGIASVKNTLDQTGGEIMETIFHINRNKTRKPNMYIVTPISKPLVLNSEQNKLIDAFRARGLDLGKFYAPPTDESNLIKLGRFDTPTAGDTQPAQKPAETSFDDDAWGEF